MIQESEPTGLDSDAAPRRMAMTECSSEDQKYLSFQFLKWDQLLSSSRGERTCFSVALSCQHVSMPAVRSQL